MSFAIGCRMWLHHIKLLFFFILGCTVGVVEEVKVSVFNLTCEKQATCLLFLNLLAEQMIYVYTLLLFRNLKQIEFFRINLNYVILIIISLTVVVKASKLNKLWGKLKKVSLLKLLKFDCPPPPPPSKTFRYVLQKNKIKLKNRYSYVHLKKKAYT